MVIGLQTWPLRFNFALLLDSRVHTSKSRVGITVQLSPSAIRLPQSVECVPPTVDRRPIRRHARCSPPFSFVHPPPDRPSSRATMSCRSAPLTRPVQDRPPSRRHVWVAPPVHPPARPSASGRTPEPPPCPVAPSSTRRLHDRPPSRTPHVNRYLLRQRHRSVVMAAFVQNSLTIYWAITAARTDLDRKQQTPSHRMPKIGSQ